MLGLAFAANANTTALPIATTHGQEDACVEWAAAVVDYYGIDTSTSAGYDVFVALVNWCYTQNEQ
jgi:hypothetical protein